MHDKAFWQAIAAADYAVPDGHNAGELALELLPNIAAPDPELRDDLTYGIIARWVLGDHFTPDDYRAMMAALLPALAVGIGERDTDTVMGRSYAALLLSVIAYADVRQPFMTGAEYDTLLDAALHYLAAEKDLRGFVPGKGFLHSCAHSADVLKFMARGQHANPARLERMLMAAADKMAAAVDTVYTHSEDERMAMAVLDIVKRDMLGADTLAAFVDRIKSATKAAAAGGPFDVTIHATYMNAKNFLRALYFRLALAGEPVAGAHDLQQRALDALKSFTT
jgi:hypothetical protein